MYNFRIPTRRAHFGVARNRPRRGVSHGMTRKSRLSQPVKSNLISRLEQPLTFCQNLSSHDLQSQCRRICPFKIFIWIYIISDKFFTNYKQQQFLFPFLFHCILFLFRKIKLQIENTTFSYIRRRKDELKWASEKKKRQSSEDVQLIENKIGFHRARFLFV